jgi:hypothetical protein
MIIRYIALAIAIFFLIPKDLIFEGLHGSLPARMGFWDAFKKSEKYEFADMETFLLTLENCHLELDMLSDRSVSL